MATPLNSKMIRFMALPLGALLLEPGLALAQDATAPQDRTTAQGDAPSAARGTQEIVVTARRREETLQDVPISISVLSPDDLARRNLQSVTELQSATPSLTATGPYRNTPIVSIRGQGGFTPGGIPAVIMYVNEVPLPTSAQAGSPGGALGANGLFFDIENIQVLKGPQGTLFGRNTTGGAILIQSRRPTMDFGGHITGTVGNYGDREIDAAINVPIVSNKVALRVATNAQKRDGFTQAASTPSHPNGLDLDDSNHFSVRGSLLARFGGVENLLVADYVESEHNGVSSVLVGATQVPVHPVNLFFPGIQAQVAAQNARGIRDIGALSADMGGYLNRWSVTNTTDIELSSTITLRNIFSYSRSEYAQTIDGDGSIFPIFDPIQSQSIPYVTRQVTNEIQLQGNSFGGKLDWVAGFFYLDQPEEDNFTQHRNVVLGQPRDVGFKQFESSKAVFAQGDFSITDQITATAGLRYTWETIGRSIREVRPSGVCFSPYANAQCVLGNEGDFSAPTWTIGLNFEPSSDAMFYVVSRRGFRSGGFNLDRDVPVAEQVFDKETVTDLEIGAKLSFGSGDFRVTANFAAYRQWYKDIQLQQTTTSAITGGPLTVNKNAGEAQIDGIEGDVSVRIGSSLRLNGHFAYTDFEYTRFDPGVVLPIYPTVPPFTFGIGGQYTLPLPASIGEFSISASYDWQDDARVVPFADPFALKPSYGLLTLGATWRNIGGEPLDLSFFMTNATDEEYILGGLPLINSVGVATLTYGAPRMFGFRLGYRFGDEAY
jgi:iron complex outermembrane recepter protein